MDRREAVCRKLDEAAIVDGDKLGIVPNLATVPQTAGVKLSSPWGLTRIA